MRPTRVLLRVSRPEGAENARLTPQPSPSQPRHAEMRKCTLAPQEFCNYLPEGLPPWPRSIPRRRDAELDHLRQLQEVPGERLGVVAVAAADHHAVLEVLALVDEAGGEV